MPYIQRGNAVYKKSGELVGKSQNPKKYMKVLRAVEHNPEFKKKLRTVSRIKR